MLIFWIFNSEIISYFTSKVSLKDFYFYILVNFCFNSLPIRWESKKSVYENCWTGTFLYYFFKILFIDTFIYKFHYGFPFFLLNLKFLSIVIFLFSAGYIVWFYFRTDDKEVGKLLLILIIILLFTGMSEQVYSSVNYYWKKASNLLFFYFPVSWFFMNYPSSIWNY